MEGTNINFLAFKLDFGGTHFQFRFFSTKDARGSRRCHCLGIGKYKTAVALVGSVAKNKRNEEHVF